MFPSCTADIIDCCRNVRVSNCSVNSPWDDGICLKSSYGLGFVEDLKLSNISILHQGGGTKDDAALQPPEIENAYPEPSRFGAMPAHGFYLRHVKGLQIRDVEVKYLKEDFRPAFVFEDVQGAQLLHVKAAHAAGAPTIVLKNVLDFSIHGSSPVSDASLEKVELKQL